MNFEFFRPKSQVSQAAVLAATLLAPAAEPVQAQQVDNPPVPATALEKPNFESTSEVTARPELRKGNIVHLETASLLPDPDSLKSNPDRVLSPDDLAGLSKLVFSWLELERGGKEGSAERNKDNVLVIIGDRRIAERQNLYAGLHSKEAACKARVSNELLEAASTVKRNEEGGLLETEQARVLKLLAGEVLKGRIDNDNVTATLAKLFQAKQIIIVDAETDLGAKEETVYLRQQVNPGRFSTEFVMQADAGMTDEEGEQKLAASQPLETGAELVIRRTSLTGAMGLLHNNKGRVLVLADTEKITDPARLSKIGHTISKIHGQAVVSCVSDPDSLRRDGVRMGEEAGRSIVFQMGDKSIPVPAPSPVEISSQGN